MKEDIVIVKAVPWIFCLFYNKFSHFSEMQKDALMMHREYYLFLLTCIRRYYNESLLVAFKGLPKVFSINL